MLLALGLALIASGEALPRSAPAEALEDLAPEGTTLGGPLAAAGASPDALVPAPPPLAEIPVSRLENAWRTPGPGLDAQVLRTRRASLELGAWSLDAAARSLAAGTATGDDLARAEAAVALAPNLPSAQVRLAQARWLDGGSPMAAVRALVEALWVIPRHVEASFWFAGTGLYFLAVALVLGGLLAIALIGISSLPHAAHDLGHLFSGSVPEFARFAGLGALLLVPLALGEGALGLALALMAIALIYGGRTQRVAMLVAAAGVGLGAYPVIQMAGAALAALPEDPVARASFAVSQGLATPVDLARLEAAAERDPLAARGLAIHARRIGRLSEADALYQRLLQGGSKDVALLNNAANVRLDLGHMGRALDLYRNAAEQEQSPVVLFNLAQAYGRAFQVEDLNRTIAEAQRVGGELVADLTTLQGTDARGFVVDFPLEPALFWKRALRPDAGLDLAIEFREPFAPGRFGADPMLLGASTLVIALVGGLLGARLTPSRWCARCGVRLCARCDPKRANASLCDGCHRLFYQPEKTDRTLRQERMNQLRRRGERVDRMATAVAVLVPGAAGLIAQRPLGCWLGAFCFTLAAAALVWRDGIVPDPLVAGAAAPLAFVGIALVSGLGYALVVATSLAARKQD